MDFYNLQAPPSPIETQPLTPGHFAEAGRICYEAFKELNQRVGLPPDFPTVQHARAMVSELTRSAGHYGLVALQEGEVVGVAFLTYSEALAALGPVAVDPAYQGQKVGRTLTEALIDFARARQLHQIRLLQDSFNTVSLSLYTSLGFDWQEAVAVMNAMPARRDDPAVEPATEADLSRLTTLSEHLYGVNRSHEMMAAWQQGTPPLVLRREGDITGYLVPGFYGHAVALTDDDLFVLVEQAARYYPDKAAFFCPLSQGDLYRRFLRAGCRTWKVMNLMAKGAYERPKGAWLCSVLY